VNLDETPVKAQPFVKWVGGKRQLQERIAEKVPAFSGRYFEPFLGGGAMFFHLNPHQAILSDVNKKLINVYSQIKADWEKVAKICDAINQEFEQSLNKSNYFYEKRTEFNSPSTEEFRSAALFLFLNKACFNGVYRENSKGHFNVPFGKRDVIQIYEPSNLKAVSLALKDAKLLDRPFERILPEYFSKDEKNPDAPVAGDLVYLDPPYIPLTKTAAFTSYTNDSFGAQAQRELQERLNDQITELTRRGVGVILSNSSAEETVRIYQSEGGMISDSEPVYASRNVSATSGGRKPVKELILINTVVEEMLKNGS
jgi:DNA adenine methylase